MPGLIFKNMMPISPTAKVGQEHPRMEIREINRKAESPSLHRSFFNLDWLKRLNGKQQFGSLSETSLSNVLSKNNKYKTKQALTKDKNKKIGPAKMNSAIL
uniref:Uncharacterized protein n=1 Tax=Cannabis sativa TaxID=3483 RepID=A0A803PSK5_CANSA